jgi:hypothetical protein
MSFEDADSQESEVTEEVTETTAPEAQVEPQPGTHPVWQPVEDLLGPNNFKLIQPHLAKTDAEYTRKITEANEALKPWKQFQEQGVTPDHVTAAINVVRQLNTEPEQVFTALRDFLEREGRMPTQTELKQEVIEDQNEEEEDPRDARIRELEARFGNTEQILQERFQQEQQAQVEREADSWAAKEWERVQTANPDLSKEDFAEIGLIIAAQTNRGEAPDLDKAVAHYNSLRDRLRTTPRPTTTAPRVPSGPGGTPSAQPLDPSTLGRDERRALVADMLARGKQ